MNRYRKISRKCLLSLMINISVSVGSPTDVISVPVIARYLKTSRYQVRKYMKELESEGLVKTGVMLYGDDECTLPIRGFCITDKARELEEYKLKENMERKFIEKFFFSEHGGQQNDLEGERTTMTDHDYLVTVYAIIEITGGYDPDSKMFKDVISKHIYDAFDGNFLQYEDYKGSFLPAESPDDIDPDISQTGEGRVSVKFFYTQNDDGAGRKDVESYASYCFKNLPMLEGLRLADVICDSETI